MRHFQIVIPQRWFITEAEARIAHPEDMVFDDGSAGAKKALSGLVHTANEPHAVTIKWDGSPAVIFGRDEDGFVLTDKSGFSSKKTNGMPRSASDLKNMLFMRKPNDAGREDYANSIAALWPLLERVVPKDFRGYLQGDLLWTKKPPVEDGHFVFQPNKIRYAIPVESPLGKLIDGSKAGIAVHSRFDSRDDPQPYPISDLDELNLNTIPQVVVMGADVNDLEATPLPSDLIKKLDAIIAKFTPSIDAFLDSSALAKNKISDLPDLMKRYVNQRAYSGQRGLEDAAQGFIKWIEGPNSGITANKRANISQWIADNKKGYQAVWGIAAQLLALKYHIKSNIDIQSSDKIQASLRGVPGHEGYVTDTPFGKFKMVDRPHFMRKTGD